MSVFNRIGSDVHAAPDRRLVCERFDTLYNELNCCQGENPNPRLYSGTEWYCAEDIAERIRNREALPMGDSDWYMVEFLEWGKVTEPAEVILSRLGKMKRAGIRTILAHAECYTAVQADWDLAKRICDLGVLLQVNAYDLCLNKNPVTRNLARWMAQERLISFIGSDMHGTRIKGDGKPARKPQMKEGVR